MNMNYKVIWFDDEYKDRKRILESAHLKGVKLIGFSNAEEGIAELEANIEAYDAALVDGLFYETESENGTPTEDAAMGKVAKALGRLEYKKSLPWFILSGQASFTKKKNRFALAFKEGKVYDKLGGDAEYESLWNKLIEEADKLPETQARRQNPQLFDIFQKGYLSGEVEEQILDLLIKPLPENTNDLKGLLTSIRSIHESCMIKLQAIDVLPDGLSFHRKNKHLSGNVRKIGDDYRPTTIVYQTTDIQNLQSWLYFTCGTYIHNLEQQQYGGYMISNYAVESLRSGLFEILLWFKKTFEENK